MKDPFRCILSLFARFDVIIVASIAPPLHFPHDLFSVHLASIILYCLTSDQSWVYPMYPIWIWPKSQRRDMRMKQDLGNNFKDVLSQSCLLMRSRYHDAKSAGSFTERHHDALREWWAHRSEKSRVQVDKDLSSKDSCRNFPGRESRQSINLSI